MSGHALQRKHLQKEKIHAHHTHYDTVLTKARARCTNHTVSYTANMKADPHVQLQRCTMPKVLKNVL